MVDIIFIIFYLSEYNMSNWRRIISLPLADNFFVFMIFEANSRPVAFWTHLLTTENAPLKVEKQGLCYKIFITKNDKKKDFSILEHERFISYDGNTCSSKSSRIIMFWLKYMFPYPSPISWYEDASSNKCYVITARE